MCKFINLRAAKIGYVGAIFNDKRGFTYFLSVAHEWRAMCLNFITKFLRYTSSSYRYCSFAEYYTACYAPPSENDTEAYFKFISPLVDKLFVQLQHHESSVETFIELYLAHARIETGFDLNRVDVRNYILNSPFAHEIDAYFSSER